VLRAIMAGPTGMAPALNRSRAGAAGRYHRPSLLDRCCTRLDPFHAHIPFPACEPVIARSPHAALLTVANRRSIVGWAPACGGKAISGVLRPP
jgi:hypothetical protein